MRVICIDADNKPKNVPQAEWLVEGQTYTVIKAVRMNLQNNKIGYSLKEVQLSEGSFPYEYYNAERFISIDHLTSLMFKQEMEDKQELEPQEFTI